MKWRQVLGVFLAVAGSVGLVTVADDLDHLGEVSAVGGILLAGILLVADGLSFFIVHRIALYWVAVGIGVGEVVGALVGLIPVGVGSGAVVGAMGSVVFRLKRQ